MERRWLVPLVIGGGAVLLVALFVLIGGGGSKTPEALDGGATSDDAATVVVDTTAPAWMNATNAPTNPATAPTLTATPSPTPTPAPNPFAVNTPPPILDDAGAAPNVPTMGTPLINGSSEQVAAVLKQHISALEEDIAKKEAAGKTAEAEREKKSLERLKGQLDMVLDAGPP